MTIRRDKLEMLTKSAEKQAALIKCGRAKVHNRDSALNAARVTLVDCRAGLAEIEEMRNVSAVWRMEVETLEQAVERAEWVLSVYENA